MYLTSSGAWTPTSSCPASYPPAMPSPSPSRDAPSPATSALSRYLSIQNFKNISKSLKNIFFPQKMSEGETCCWVCTRCQDFEYQVDEFNCEDCGVGRSTVHTDIFVLLSRYLFILYVKHVVTTLFPFQVASCKQVILLRYRGRRIT